MRIYTRPDSLHRCRRQSWPLRRYSYPIRLNKANMERIRVGGWVGGRGSRPHPYPLVNLCPLGAITALVIQVRAAVNVSLQIHPFLSFPASRSVLVAPASLVSFPRKGRNVSPPDLGRCKDSQRRKDWRPCHSSRARKSSNSTNPSISAQSRKPARSSQPCRRVYDTAQGGYSISQIPYRQRTNRPCRIGSRCIPTGQGTL